MMVFSNNMITRISLPLLILIKSGNGAPIFNDNVTSDPMRINDSVGSGIFFTIGLIMSVVNMIGCLMIIITTLNARRGRIRKKFPPSQKFPFYMSLLDLSVVLIIIPNLLYHMHSYKLNSGILCKAMGFTMSILITMNMMLMTLIAVKTYLNICRRYPVDLGSYDWILIVSVSVPSLLISLVPAAFRGYGQDNYWCYLNRTNEGGGKVSMIISISFVYIVMGITSFCYLKVIKKIHNVESKLTSESLKSYAASPSCFMTMTSHHSNQSHSPHSRRKIASNIARATRKITVYILLQLLQYVPIIIDSLCFLFNFNHVWIYVLFIVLINLGSVAKSCVFLRNEVFCIHRDYGGRSTCKFTRESKGFNSKRASIASSTKSLISVTYPPKSHLSTIEEDDGSTLTSFDLNGNDSLRQEQYFIMTPPSSLPSTPRFGGL